MARNEAAHCPSLRDAEKDKQIRQRHALTQSFADHNLKPLKTP